MAALLPPLSSAAPCLCLLWAACAFNPEGSAGVSGDSGSGAVADAGPEIECRSLLPFTPSNIDTCALGPDNGTVSLDRLGVYDIDTDLAMMFEPGGATRMFDVAMVAPPDAPAMVVVLTSQFQLGAEAVLNLSGSRTMAV